MLDASKDEDPAQSEKDSSDGEHAEDQEHDAPSPSFSPESTDIVTPEEMDGIRKKTGRKGEMFPSTSSADWSCAEKPMNKSDKDETFLDTPVYKWVTEQPVGKCFYPYVLAKHLFVKIQN